MWGHTATLLCSGKVLVVGGATYVQGPNGQILTGYLNSAELYDPVSDTWSDAAPLPSGRAFHTATLLPSQRKVLVMGGITDDNYIEEYDEATNTWEPQPDWDGTPEPRGGATATLLASDEVLVTGGWLDEFCSPSANLFDPATNTWTPVNDMIAPRGGHQATAIKLPDSSSVDPSEKVLVMGGGWCYATIPDTPAAERFDRYATDPRTGIQGTWTSAGNTTVLDQHAQLLLDSGKLLVAGGMAFDPAGQFTFSASAALYDAGNDTWAAAGAMSWARAQHTASMLSSGAVVVAGGMSLPSEIPLEDTAELYDPGANQWFPAGPMVKRRYGHVAVVLSSGQVLVVGGKGREPDDSRSAELYTP